MIHPDLPRPRVVFFQVRSPSDKIARIAQTAESHFSQRERLLLLAEEDKALAFVDELLWKYPGESFLPHAIVEADCEDWIALSKIKKNFNQAKVVFNLCPTPLFLDCHLRIIYDFDDASSSQKKALSQIRFEAYKQANFTIESRN